MRTLGIAVTALACIGLAYADFFTGFEASEGYTASAAGDPLTFGFGGGGQQGWYNPVSGSFDYKVYTYAGNALGIATNPFGGGQFAASTTGPAGELARAQRDHDWSTRTTWTVSYDVLGATFGTNPALNNLGSFSLQDSTTQRFYIQLLVWADPNNPGLGWHVQFNVFNASGGALNNQSPGPDFNNLQINHWYRLSTTFDLSTNLITQVTLVDLTTLQTFVSNPQGWYLHGGATPTRPLPTAFRLFTGGGTGTSPNSNVVAWDNINIVPEPASLVVLSAVAFLALRRRK
jgi:hypothetical protein